METLRYGLGVLLVVSFPPAFLYWLLIHPLVRFWRRLGPVRTYATITPIALLIGYSLFRWRAHLVGRDLGSEWLLILAGVGLYIGAALLEWACRRHLDLRTLVGLPELSVKKPGRLLTDGVYSHIRHPRYASILLGTIGFALIVNYSGVYLFCGAMIPIIYIVMILEERELTERFGPDYQRYQREVPRLIPRQTFWRS